MSLAKSDIHKTIPDLFERQVLQHPNHTAFEYGDVKVSYSDLSRRVNEVATIVTAHNPGRESPVLVFMEPSMPSVATFFGILQAGAICSLVDRSNPQNRLDSIIGDLRPGLCIADQSSFEAAQNLAGGKFPVVLIDSQDDLPEINRDLRLENPDAAVIVYTSGSTGVPKGVLHNEQSLVHVVWFHAQRLKLGPTDRTLFLPSSTGIAGALLILRTLLTGGTLVQFPGQSISGQELSHMINANAITSMTMVPSLFREMMTGLEETARLPTLRTIILGGEPLTAGDVRHFQQHCGPDCILLNTYGCTEIPTFRTYPIDMNTVLPWRQVPVGYEVEDKEVVLIDDDGKPVATGDEGEIAIRSEFMARGYWRNAEETSRRFIPPNESGGLRMYRTGDRGYFLEGHVLVCTGRQDQQVKVMGNRVELGEIENVLSQHPCVNRAAIIANATLEGATFLVAFVVAEESSDVGENELRKFLLSRLPTYMIPARISIVASLPLTPNGKIDREALRAWDPGRVNKTELPSQTKIPSMLERSLLKIWNEVLRVPVSHTAANFFELGGDSLSATRVVARVYKEFQVELPPRTLFESPTLTEFSEAVQGGQTLPSESFSLAPPSRANDGPLPLSFAQQRLWFLTQWEPESVAYHMPYAWRLQGPIDRDALAAAFGELIARHESLRTTFHMVNDEPVQVIHTPPLGVLPLIDLSTHPDAAQEPELSRLMDEEIHRPFDLTAGPLLRTQLLRLGPNTHVLLVILHHIITDGWSMRIFWKELSALYVAQVTDHSATLPPLPLQYADFAVWQRKWLQGDVLAQQINYWTRKLNDAPPALNLPTDAPRPPQQSSKGGIASFTLPPALTLGLKTLSQQSSVTLFMTLLAAFQLLLARYSGQRDILVGTPSAGRTGLELEELIGFFANTLVLRTTFTGQPSFRAILQHVRDTCLNAYEHQDLPFEKLVEELQPIRDLSRHPLFQVMFQLIRQHNRGPKLPGVEVTSYPRPHHTAKFDLNCTLREQDGALYGDLEYSTDLFQAATITCMTQHFQILLEGILDNPDQSVFHIPFLTDTDRQQVLSDWNPPLQPTPTRPCLHELFETQVERTPEVVAATYDTEQLTYTELNKRANQLAHYLQQYGVGPEACVGVCVDRSLDLLVGVLGILKAGAVCVPLDPTYPQKRLSLMATQANVRVIVTQSPLVQHFNEFSGSFIRLDTESTKIAQEQTHIPQSELISDNVVYVLYTSGSTGHPKGVALSHAALVNLIVWQGTVFPAGQRTLQFASMGFDVSFLEIFSTWSNGGTVVMVPEERRRDTTKLISYLSEQRIERAILPSMLLTQLVTMPPTQKWDFTALTDIVTTGDQLQISPATVSQFTYLTGCRLHNFYGPTESHVVTAHTLSANPNDWPELPPIGSPIANTQLWLVDREGNVVPPGIVGELHIGGVCLARGYVNQPGLTAERFRPSPVETKHGARAYQTGDHGRHDRTGAIHFLGRRDHQVKLRGYRIELAEIEVVLGEQAGIQENIVVCREDVPGEKQLVAYIIPAFGVTPDTASLRTALKIRLPEYMIPTSFVVFERFPLTSNGKIDRRALPAPDSSHRALAATYEAPANPVEEILAETWQELLNLTRVGRHDDFFALGGHSLLATRLVARLNNEHEIDLPLRLLFEHPTLADQAAAIQETLLQEIDHLSESELDELIDTDPPDQLSPDHTRTHT